MLARMGALLELEAPPARSEVLLELKELYVAREALVKDRTAADAGKPAKVALTAIMRKLIVLANAANGAPAALLPFF